MPNRVIKESICTSDTLNQLSDFQFRLWVGLLVSADDAGRGDARPAIIKGRVFPLRDRITVKDVNVALQALAACGCVSLYHVGGKPYYWFPTWAEHQRLDRAKPKYPAPEDADPPQESAENSSILPSAADCGELPQIAADCGLNTNTNTKGNTNTNTKGNTNTNTKENGNTRAARFTPPTVEEVQAFISEHGDSVDAQKFVDYYESNGWKVGKNPMRDWQAAVRTWVRRDSEQQMRAVRDNPALNYAQRKVDDAYYADIPLDLEAKFGG